MMNKSNLPGRLSLALIIPIIFLVSFSVLVLRSVAPGIFPHYFIYIFLAVIIFFIFSAFDFEVISAFSWHLYIFSIFLLLLTLVIGRVTRGTVRWIPIGSLSIQTTEIVRPFLIIFFANYLTDGELTVKRLFKAILLFLLPVILILVQPSLGVAVLTTISFFGVFIAGDFKKKYLLLGGVGIALIIPLFWFILAPYQKQRILTFIEPGKDPRGAGYNAIQSMISVGGGKLTGRGLGKGVGTQLAFLPEKHTDFIFAAISEEMGFIGSGLLLIVTFYLLSRLISYIENAKNPAARAYLSGLFLTFFAQVMVHVGMNMGLFPITGIPYPFVSAGGSSLLATATAFGIVFGTQKS